MRPSQNKRMRGRNNNNGGNRKGPNPLTRSYESNGPDVKIRGNAHHIAEKYLQLARDAQSSGDPVGAESYLQHAEHYFRLIASYQQAQMGFGRQVDEPDGDGDDEDGGLPDRFASPQAPAPFVPQPPPQLYPAQPYANDRQPPYAERGQGQDRQPYQDRPFNGERGQGQDRNGYDRSQRPDRNGQQRRPYRDDTRNGEFRGNDRRNAYERAQERAQHQERFSGDRSFREQQIEPPRDLLNGEQPRVEAQDAPFDTQPVRSEPVLRPEPPARGDEAPGLPSFITTPTRIIGPEPAATPVEAVPVAAFPGDDAADVPKFPRRRRRTTRTAAGEPEVPVDQPANE